MLLIKFLIGSLLGFLVFVVFLGAVLADQDRSPLLEFGNDVWHA